MPADLQGAGPLGAFRIHQQQLAFGYCARSCCGISAAIVERQHSGRRSAVRNTQQVVQHARLGQRHLRRCLQQIRQAQRLSHVKQQCSSCDGCLKCMFYFCNDAVGCVNLACQDSTCYLISLALDTERRYRWHVDSYVTVLRDGAGRLDASAAPPGQQLSRLRKHAAASGNHHLKPQVRAGHADAADGQNAAGPQAQRFSQRPAGACQPPRRHPSRGRPAWCSSARSRPGWCAGLWARRAQ